MCIGQLFSTSSDSRRELRSLGQTVVCAMQHPNGYVFACAHTFIYIALLIENGADCVMENCRPNNVGREEHEEGESNRNTF